MNRTYEAALGAALSMMEREAELEPTSALKEAGRLEGIPWGEEMGRFVEWALARLVPGQTG